MNILTTGGLGFIGSNFMRYMLDKHSDINIINLDAITYAGNVECTIDEFPLAPITAYYY
jgi:dTDP-glucose 4,6-dehydratase